VDVEPRADQPLRGAAAPLPRVQDAEYERLRGLVYQSTGIDLGERKHHLVEARLGRRLRALGLASYAAYYEVIAGSRYDPAELRRFIDAMTTNETSFFREAQHVEYLAREWLPALRESGSGQAGRVLRLWSACCASGEEPYTIAMTLLDALGEGSGWSARILASDINLEVLEHAARGIYPVARVAPVPQALRSRYLVRGKDLPDDVVQVHPALRRVVVFREINLIDEPWPVRPGLDAIFCRNALIYFDVPTKKRILERFIALLAPGGLLVLGHSESIHGLVDGVAHVRNTIYRRAVSSPAAASPGPAARAP
jgi:chemotaxis protein methyltransferase CheR